MLEQVFWRKISKLLLLLRAYQLIILLGYALDATNHKM